MRVQCGDVDVVMQHSADGSLLDCGGEGGYGTVPSAVVPV